MYPLPIQNLIDKFRRLPGVGPRQAARFVFALLGESPSFREALARDLTELASLLHTCERCGNMEAKASAKGDLCSICANPKREQARIAVVEDVTDLRAIERTRIFNGVYHVLAGHFDAIGEGEANVARVAALVERVLREQPQEVIVATSPTHDGEIAGHLVARELATTGVSVTHLARGLARGVDIEYVDDETLREAMAGRR